ncbi:hypothetical protein WN51_14148 [Melipona quadrifasciata]|uniref:Uncharacterized protein n=1 Tax=Melipona quadrifasciata TaxID=166423 RepID=A0A0N0BFZ8_9HYME|nr:hypothetical protein WN51_14148 [Melipona quadrifasciata]
MYSSERGPVSTSTRQLLKNRTYNVEMVKGISKTLKTKKENKKRNRVYINNA